MTDKATDTAEETPTTQTKAESLPPVSGKTPAQLAPIEMGIWLNIKEAE